jgi:hypothetical protein
VVKIVDSISSLLPIRKCRFDAAAAPILKVRIDLSLRKPLARLSLDCLQDRHFVVRINQWTMRKIPVPAQASEVLEEKRLAKGDAAKWRKSRDFLNVGAALLANSLAKPLLY